MVCRMVQRMATPPAVVSEQFGKAQIYVMTINGHRFFKEATE